VAWALSWNCRCDPSVPRALTLKVLCSTPFLRLFSSPNQVAKWPVYVILLGSSWVNVNLPSTVPVNHDPDSLIVPLWEDGVEEQVPAQAVAWTQTGCPCQVRSTTSPVRGVGLGRGSRTELTLRLCTGLHGHAREKCVVFGQRWLLGFFGSCCLLLVGLPVNERLDV